MAPLTVSVTRGGIRESLHRVHVAVADATGLLLGSAGDPELVAFMRSSAKPIQALPLVESGAAAAFGLEDRHLAIACASHMGMPIHTDAASDLLHRAGLGPEHLCCGPHAPEHRGAAEALVRAGRAPERIHNNCSGKHAGMLATCVHLGWDLATYLDPDHALQRRIQESLAELSSWRPVLGSDGCGVPTFALPLRAMATAFARLASGRGARLADAMAAHPELVSGPGHLNTDLLAGHGHRILTKGGAEGVWCYAVRGATAVGVALKVEDGSPRPLGPALLETLAALGLPGGGDPRLDAYRNPPVRNTLGHPVGGFDVEVPATLVPA